MCYIFLGRLFCWFNVNNGLWFEWLVVVKGWEGEGRIYVFGMIWMIFVDFEGSLRLI